MNEKPHAHTPYLSEGHSSLFRWPSSDGCSLTYGDTKVTVSKYKHMPTDEQIERAFKKAVELHDRGSIEAGAIEDRKKAQNAMLFELARTHGEEIKEKWGDEEVPPVISPPSQHVWTDALGQRLTGFKIMGGSGVSAEEYFKRAQRELRGFDVGRFAPNTAAHTHGLKAWEQTFMGHEVRGVAGEPIEMVVHEG